MKKFILAVLERAVRTFCQSLAALLIGAGTGLLDTSWTEDFSVAGMAGLLSILTSVGTGLVSSSSNPSIGGVEVVDKKKVIKLGDRGVMDLTLILCALCAALGVLVGYLWGSS